MGKQGKSAYATVCQVLGNFRFQLSVQVLQHMPRR